MPLNREQIINGLCTLGQQLNVNTDEFEAIIYKACFENLWFTPDNCIKAMAYWKSQLVLQNLIAFSAPYPFAGTPKKVGIIMAGNIPMVGMHDLVCTLLSGHTAIIKTSSDDNVLMSHVVTQLQALGKDWENQLYISERIPKEIDAVIATGSNNSFRYFEYYFKNIPSLLRKNRKSLAILSGNESSEELGSLAADIFEYYGLGCRNVSLILLPEGSSIIPVIDAFEEYHEHKNHNRFANNYTYHRALFLMNQQEHLDNGFVLIKQERSLTAPLGCIFYDFYKDSEDLMAFLDQNQEQIQCVVGKNNQHAYVNFGESQSPKLQDFADKIDSMQFLSQL